MHAAHAAQGPALPEVPRPRIFFAHSTKLLGTGKPTGVAVSHCITWFQTQLILTTCQIRYHGQCGIIVVLDSSEP